MIFHRAIRTKIFIAAVLACSTLPVSAAQGCMAVAGMHIGAFTAKGIRIPASMPSEITGTWTAYINGKCEVTGTVTSDVTGTIATKGEFGAYDPDTRLFDPKNLFLYGPDISTRTVLMGTDQSTKQRYIKINTKEFTYEGEHQGGLDNIGHFKNRDEKMAVLYSRDNDQKIELTVVSEAFLAQLFKSLAERKDIPYAYLIDGSWARVHQMTLILKDNSVIAGKAFVEGELFVDTTLPERQIAGETGLSYHVAPVVMVQKEKSITPYILDPSLFSEPVTHAEWKAKLLAKSKAKLSREYYTNRFSLYPEDRTAKRSENTEDELNEMKAENRNSIRRLYYLNSKK